MGEQLHVGTSGWHYDHWKGPFYPRELGSDGFLERYAKSFDTAEINSSFYRLPEEKTLQEWREAVPREFIFPFKASRYLTHMKKLKDPEEPLQRMLQSADTLGEKLGPILFQLPPRWRENVERLRSFLDALPEGYCYAFEFRDESWFTPGVYEALSEHGAAFCVYDLGGKTSPLEVTSDFAYLRLHGPEEAYRGRYGERGLTGWAEWIHGWLSSGYEVFCYFDNDEAGYAPLDALELKRMLE